MLMHGVFAILFCTANLVYAGDWRLGGSIGYGGAGVISPQKVQGTSIQVQRSEGPGVVSLFVDDLLDDKWLLTIEHSRGFRLGPASSGASFTGVAIRRYLSPAPALSGESAESQLFIKRYVFFYGLASGFAQAYITRSNDLVSSVWASGVYIGIKLGADYALGPRWGFRPEIISNMTFMSNESPASSLTEFALQFAFFRAF